MSMHESRRIGAATEDTTERTKERSFGSTVLRIQANDDVTVFSTLYEQKARENKLSTLMRERI